MYMHFLGAMENKFMPYLFQRLKLTVSNGLSAITCLPTVKNNS